MRLTLSRSTRLLAAGTLLLLVGGCSIIPVRAGAVRTDSRTIDVGGATSARVEIDLGAGELTVGSGSSGLATAKFTYNVASLKPKVTYRVTGTIGALKISQPAGPLVFGKNTRYRWDVTLSDSVPIDLQINTGAAKSELALGGLSLTSVKISGGAGDLRADLSGDWSESTTIAISGGVGKISVLLPASVGARVEASTGVGTVTANGLSRDGHIWTNSEYGKSPVTLDVTISTGVGEVSLDAG